MKTANKPRAIILSGYGLNCEEETAHAFVLAGARADIVHINDLVEGAKKLSSYQILAVPGGFSYGDDTGSGKAYANKLRNHLYGEIQKFLQKDKLAIGICNGFQILANLNLVPGALTFNDNARYTARWVDLKTITPPLPSPSRGGNINSQRRSKSFLPLEGGRQVGVSPWLAGITALSLPIAHGEGKFIADDAVLKTLIKNGQIAFQYVKGEICEYQNLPANPNGAIMDIAGVTDATGRILGMMPHPERAIFFTQLPNWPVIKEKLIRSGKRLPQYGPGLQIFKNAVRYFG